MFSWASRITRAPALARHGIQKIAYARRRFTAQAEKKIEEEASENAGAKKDWQLIAKVGFYVATFVVPWTFLTQIRDDLEFRYYMEDNHPEKLRMIESLFPAFVPPLSGYVYTLTEKPEEDVEIVVQKGNKEEAHSLIDPTESVKDVVASLSLEGSDSIRTCPASYSFQDPVKWIHHVADNPHLYAFGASMSKEQLKDYVARFESRVSSARGKVTVLQAQNAQGLVDEVEIQIAQKELDALTKKLQRYNDLLTSWNTTAHWKPEKMEDKGAKVVAPTASKKSFSLFTYFTSESKPEIDVQDEQPLVKETNKPHLDSADVLTKSRQQESAQLKGNLYAYGAEVDEGLPELFATVPPKQLIMSENQERIALHLLKRVSDKVVNANGKGKTEDSDSKKVIAPTIKTKTLGEIFSDGKKMSMTKLNAAEDKQQETVGPGKE